MLVHCTIIFCFLRVGAPRSSPEADRQQQAAAPALLRPAGDGENFDHPGVRQEALRRRLQDDGPGGGRACCFSLLVRFVIAVVLVPM